MIVEEKNPERLKDLLAAAQDQTDLIRRIIIETEPEFQRSKLKALLFSKQWPHAVDPNLLVSSEEEDRFDRAEAILDWVLGSNLQDKKFLDFGCGEGHVAYRASLRSKLSVGYDLNESGWEKFKATDRFFLTSDFQEIHRHGPYDVILLFDVLDHIVTEDPKDVLKDLHGILKDNGKVHVRCHPWCSRSGAHAYNSLNKAYLHFFFTPEELEKMGVKSDPIRKIIHPITTYDDWFLKSGFKKLDSESNVMRQSVEPFFEQEPILAKLIKDHWKDSYEERLSSGKVFPKHQLEQTMLDFVLVKA